MIQIDIEMPKSCVDCFLMRHMHCSITCESIPLEKRLDNCPLHEVTDSDTISRKQAIDALKEALNPSKGKVRPYDSLWDMYLDEFEDDCGERV